ncbi:hypothetical protein BJ964_004013 [Actinoplanes lobatus]|uniref:Uncharacterized protein n=1 Tax=Actinoplanes lobatus TaxID=113568 RepID=A0A7W7MGV4_9ACTN|nr:hypothetical protein [Actinoplanes lobatus]
MASSSPPTMFAMSSSRAISMAEAYLGALPNAS